MTFDVPDRRPSLFCPLGEWAFSLFEGASLAFLGLASVAALTAFGYVQREYLNDFAILFLVLAVSGFWPLRIPNPLLVRAFGGIGALAYLFGTMSGKGSFGALFREVVLGYRMLLQSPADHFLPLWRSGEFFTLRTMSFGFAIVVIFLLALGPLRRLRFLWVFVSWFLVGVSEAYLGFSGEILGCSEAQFSLFLTGASISYLFFSAEGLRLLAPRRAFYAFFVLLLLGASVLGTAAALPKPPPSWDDPWPEFTQRLARAGKTPSQPSFSSIHALGGPFVALGEVHVNANFPVGVKVPTRWRIASYDIYTGKDWQRSSQLSPSTGAGELFAVPVEAGVDFEIVSRLMDVPVPGVLEKPYAFFEGTEKPLSFLLERGAWRGVPVGIPYRIRVFPYTPEFEALPLEKSLLQSQPLSAPERFQITTSLDLPSDLSPSVWELANRLRLEALGSDRPPKNPEEAWRIAQRVQVYLRDEGNFTYEMQDVPFLRPGEDYVTEFLFTTRRGYCEHFASAAVVLLRAAGVPSRFVVGYGPGEITTTVQGTHVVLRDRDAHAWAEVYLEGLGFVPLEVTPGAVREDTSPTSAAEGDPLPLPSFDPPLPSEGLGEAEATPSSEGPMFFPSRAMPIALLAAGVLIVLAWFAFGRHWKRKDSLGVSLLDREALRNRYRRDLWIMQVCGEKREPGETVGAYAARLPKSPMTESFWRVTQAYLVAFYGPTSQGGDDFLEREREFFISIWHSMPQCLWQNMRRMLFRRFPSISGVFKATGKS